MFEKDRLIILILSIFYLSAASFAGPYNDAGIYGYIGADLRHAAPDDADAAINPIFRGWATGVKDYLPSDDIWFGPGVWDDPNKALGPATGNVGDIVSLGDLDEFEIADGCQPGQVTLVFGDPCLPNDPNHIRNVAGFDFAVFENGLICIDTDPFYGVVQGQIFAELAFVEVSSDGINFARFPGVSLTSTNIAPGGTVDSNNILNFAGKHPNGYGWCIGTAFDLDELTDEPNVISGVVDINDIVYVRIVDIPGSGDFADKANSAGYIDPCSWPGWVIFAEDHPVYDGWLTEGSGGFDLEAVGVLKEQNFSADVNLDGAVDLFDFAAFTYAWRRHFGQKGWLSRCNLSGADDLYINSFDLAEFSGQWLGKENWRN